MPNIICSNCGFRLGNLPNYLEITACPRCASGDRTVILTDSCRGYEKLRLREKDGEGTGKNKVARETTIGDDFHKAGGRWVWLKRVIDRRNDRYFEQVVEPESGTTIHKCDEPLSEHFGHGSAKNRKSS